MEGGLSNKSQSQSEYCSLAQVRTLLSLDLALVLTCTSSLLAFLAFLALPSLVGKKKKEKKKERIAPRIAPIPNAIYTFTLHSGQSMVCRHPTWSRNHRHSWTWDMVPISCPSPDFSASKALHLDRQLPRLPLRRFPASVPLRHISHLSNVPISQVHWDDPMVRRGVPSHPPWKWRSRSSHFCGYLAS